MSQKLNNKVTSRRIALVATAAVDNGSGESWMAVNSDPKDDGRVSYYCKALVPDGSCNWINNKKDCNEREGVCSWEPYP